MCVCKYIIKQGSWSTATLNHKVNTHFTVFILYVLEYGVKVYGGELLQQQKTYSKRERERYRKRDRERERIRIREVAGQKPYFSFIFRDG